MLEFSLFRRQYLLGPRSAVIPGWRAVPFGASSILCTHPELPVAEIRGEDRELICVGDMFSPLQPQADNHSVLQSLFDQFTDFEKIEQASSAIGGRWMLLARRGIEMRAYPDATASRPIYHCSRDGDTWVASLPSLLAGKLALVAEPASDGTPMPGPSSGWWSGALTPYREIRQSLPNHYLDLVNRVSTRFWPRQQIAPLDVETAASEINRLLLGIITAASSRYELYVALTGGYDSRLLAAISTPLHHKIRFFTLDYPGIVDCDLAIPSRLAKGLGLRYTREVFEPAPEDFVRDFDTVASGIAGGQCVLNAYSYARFPNQAVFVEGTASEVLRCYFYKDEPHPATIDAAALAKKSRLEGNPIAEAEIGRWLQGVPRGMGVSILDLYFWEQEEGGRNAGDFTTQELTRFVFSPFSCRRLLEVGLGSATNVRQRPHLLHRTACRLACPQVLEEPFNVAPNDIVKAATVRHTDGKGNPEVNQRTRPTELAKDQTTTRNAISSTCERSYKN